MLNTKTVVGEPIAAEGRKFSPLISLGFSAGGGGGTDPQEGDCAWLQPVVDVCVRSCPVLHDVPCTLVLYAIAIGPLRT